LGLFYFAASWNLSPFYRRVEKKIRFVLDAFQIAVKLKRIAGTV
jgi:hypothetical protein